MQEEYEFVLKTEKLPSYNRISYIVFVLNAAALFFIAVITDNKSFQRYAFAGSIISIVWTVLNLLRYYNTHNQRLRFVPGYVFMALVWVLLHQYLAAAVIVVLGVLDFYARRELVVRFTREAVRYPSFPPRTIAWNQLQHAVLKDGLLTIDFASNRMVQAEVDDSSASNDETAFNAFAAACIKAAAAA